MCDGVPLDPIAAAAGTPLYVYSAATIAARYRAIDAAFAGYPHAIHYALKANSTLAITRLLRSLGSHADANSGGEIDVAMRAGFIPSQIVFTGVGKTTAELGDAIDLGVRTINVESEGEIERIDTLSRERKTRTNIAIRVNPDVDAKTHPHISTGLKTNKFGIALDEVRALCGRTRGRPEHRDCRPPRARRFADYQHGAARARRARSCRPGAAARRATAPRSSISTSAADSACRTTARPCRTPPTMPTRSCRSLRESGLAIVLEPGRHVVAPAGALLTRVVDVKEAGGGRLFVVMDAGMTELIRPMLYNAFHRIEPVIRHGRACRVADIVGPLCESSDTLGKDRTIPRPQVGDLFAVLDAGAYGSVMASNYNRRLLPAEVMVENGVARVIRRRQTLEDVLALEV